MRNIKSHSFIFGMLLITLTLGLELQAQPSFIARVERTIKVKEPQYVITHGICTCSALTPGQKSVTITEWLYRGKHGNRRNVNIHFYELASAEEASLWMGHYDRGEMSEGWQGSRMDLGDEAFLAQFKDGRRTSITIRKDNNLVMLSGEMFTKVNRFAFDVAAETAFSKDVTLHRTCRKEQLHCDVQVEPGRASKVSGIELPWNIVDRIVDVVAPPDWRGKLIRSFQMASGKNGRLIDIYEHVVISRATTGGFSPEATIRFASVQWAEHKQ